MMHGGEGARMGLGLPELDQKPTSSDTVSPAAHGGDAWEGAWGSGA